MNLVSYQHFTYPRFIIHEYCRQNVVIITAILFCFQYKSSAISGVMRWMSVLCERDLELPTF